MLAAGGFCCADATTGAADVGTNTLDQCDNTEPGCYGDTKSCPAPSTVNGLTNVTGTLMSYCHLNNLPGCTSSLVFADRNRTSLLPAVAANATQGCFTAGAGQAITIFLNGFE